MLSCTKNCDQIDNLCTLLLALVVHSAFRRYQRAFQTYRLELQCVEDKPVKYFFRNFKPMNENNVA